MELFCSNCKKPLKASIKPCEKCKVTLYCSRDCKKTNWKAHKKICAKQSNNNNFSPLSPPQGLSQPIRKPFTRLEGKTWLHDRPAQDLYRILIDAYRMGIHDSLRLDNMVEPDSIYHGGVLGFCRFLDQVESHQGLLPTWWSGETRQACLDLGMDSSQHYRLHDFVDNKDMEDRYGCLGFLMELRVFMQSVTGRGPGGMDASPFMEIMIEGEQALENMSAALTNTDGGRNDD